jgi:uncharacterized protein involved in exopolysaccharide biosynthesis
MEQVQDFTQIKEILQRRKHWLIWPFLAIAAVAGIVSLMLPNTYQSSATILIQNQQIPPTLVPSTVTTFADQRIQTITQEVMSRSKLLKLVDKYNLFREKREKLAAEDLVEGMRKRIHIEPIKAEMGTKPAANSPVMIIAFSLAYEDEDARKAQAVANEIASYYMEKNLESRERHARGTTVFLEEQMQQERARIQELENKLANYRQQHMEELPEFTALNMQKVEKLNTDLGEIRMQMRSFEEQRTLLRGQLAAVSPYLASGGGGSRLQEALMEREQLLTKYPESNPLVQAKNQEIAILEGRARTSGRSSGRTEAQIQALELKLNDLKTRYGDSHPEVQNTQREMERLRKAADVEARGRGAGAAGQGEAASNPAYVQLKSELDKLTVAISGLQAEEQRLQEQMKALYTKLQAMPMVAKEYNDLDSEYQAAKNHYREIQQKLLAARVSQGMEEEQLGESFQVVEPAFLPEKPFKPNRLAIVLIGLVLGVGCSVGLAALREVTDQTVRDRETVERLAEVPVLATIPEILLPEEVMQKKRRRMLLATSTVGGFAMVIIAFHLFYMDLYVFCAKLERFLQKRMP